MSRTGGEWVGPQGRGGVSSRSFSVKFCLVFVLSGDAHLASSGCVLKICACTQQCTISAMGCLSIQTFYIWLLSYKNGSLGPKHVCFVCYVCLFFFSLNTKMLYFSLGPLQCAVCGGRPWGDCRDLSALNLEFDLSCVLG